MLTPMIREMLPLICTEGDTGFLMAADGFEGSEDKYNQAFGRILRNYVAIQTYVRMSLPIPVDIAKQLTDDNNLFGAEDRKYVEAVSYGGWYGVPLGPYYLRLECPLFSLASHMSWLEAQPIRELYLNTCEVSTDLQLVLRNFRIQYIQRMSLSFSWGGRNKNASDIAQYVAQIQGHSLQRLALTYGVNDRLGIIKAQFQGNRSIPKGCELFMGQTRVHVRK